MASLPFGRLLRQHRHRLGLTQEKLADRASISMRHLNFLENGKAQPSREAALEIAQALEVPPQDLGVFLEAAGYVAPTTQAAVPIEPASELAGVLERISDPALLHDRYGSILFVNRRLLAICTTVVPQWKEARSTHAGHQLLESLQSQVENWSEFSNFWRRRVFLELLRAAKSDPALEGLYQRWGANDANTSLVSASTPLLLRWQQQIARFDLLAATLGTPGEVGLRDYRLVLVLAGNEVATRLVANASEG